MFRLVSEVATLSPCDNRNTRRRRRLASVDHISLVEGANLLQPAHIKLARSLSISVQPDHLFDLSGWVTSGYGSPDMPGSASVLSLACLSAAFAFVLTEAAPLVRQRC